MISVVEKSVHKQHTDTFRIIQWIFRSDRVRESPREGGFRSSFQLLVPSGCVVSTYLIASEYDLKRTWIADFHMAHGPHLRWFRRWKIAKL